MVFKKKLESSYLGKKIVKNAIDLIYELPISKVFYAIHLSVLTDASGTLALNYIIRLHQWRYSTNFK